MRKGKGQAWVQSKSTGPAKGEVVRKRPFQGHCLCFALGKVTGCDDGTMCDSGSAGNGAQNGRGSSGQGRRKYNHPKTKRRLLYLKTQCVPRSKHSSSLL